MLNRRRFIRYSVLAAGGLSAGFAGSSNNITPFESAIRKILLTDLHGLKVSSADISQYAHEVAKSNEPGFNKATAQLICLLQACGLQGMVVPFSKRCIQLRADIMGNFLLSTDFFLNKMDEEKIITYSGIIYHPSKAACANPFSGSFYKAEPVLPVGP